MEEVNREYSENPADCILWLDCDTNGTKRPDEAVRACVQYWLRCTDAIYVTGSRLGWSYCHLGLIAR